MATDENLLVEVGIAEFSTTYRPLTNGQIERTNQILEDRCELVHRSMVPAEFS